jgi:hypothetical protein
MNSNVSSRVYLAFSILLVSCGVLFGAGTGAMAQEPTQGKAVEAEAAAGKDPASRLLGTWECLLPGGKSILVFESKTHLNIDGERVKYTLVPGAIRVQDESGTQEYPYALQGKVLTIAFPEGFELEFTRVSDSTKYTGGEYLEETDAGTEAGDSGEGGAGQPSKEGGAGRSPAGGGDADLMRHFAGTWWSATKNTETHVTLTPDGLYFEDYESSYSGTTTDQYGNPDMSWGGANQQNAQGTWSVQGTREQGTITILLQNGNQREINYRVHVENGQVYWSEYYFNGDLYWKKKE